MTTLADDTPLPQLRDELRLEPASASADGEPRWRCYDPLRHRFFLLGEGDVKLLSLWRCGTVGALRSSLAKANALLDDIQLAGLIDFLRTHHLVRSAPDAGSAQLMATARQQRGSGWRWLVQRYMGMRFALWRPQAFLDATLPWLHALRFGPVFSAWAFFTVAGLYLATKQWDSFTTTFVDFLTPGGALAYGTALLALKVVHELGHAYAAAHHGCRVSSMGVSVVMGVPMLYTDTTAASRLPERHQRMWIAAGGVLAESIVAGLATFAWAVLPEGSARSIAFVLATSSWLMTLTINLNPFSRFDGYYFISDALGIENLQSRALACAGWALGRLALGRIEPAPEALPRRRAFGFVAYGSMVWAYRAGLYVGLAALAYAYLFKAAGVIVLGLELWLFIGKPIWRKVGQWWQLRGHIARQRRLALAGLAASLVVLAAMPLDRSVAVPAMLTWQHETVLQAPENARILEVLVRAGQLVKAGDTLLRLEAPELRIKRAAARIHRLSASERLDRISGDQKDRLDSTVLAQERHEAEAELQGLDARAQLLELRAPADGVVADLAPHLQAGLWVRPELTLVRVLHGSARDARGFVSERDAARLAVGARGRFVADDPALASLPMTLQDIEPHAAEQITPPAMSSLHGGQIAAQADAGGREVPVTAQHRIRFAAVATPLALAFDQAPMLPKSLRGEVVVDAEPKSLLAQASAQLWRLFMVEMRD